LKGKGGRYPSCFAVSTHWEKGAPFLLQILKETGGEEPRIISERLQIKPSDIEREFATLRHMEKVKGDLREGKKIICVW